MNELLFEYYYDPRRVRVCLNCKHYFKHMQRHDVQNIQKHNELLPERKYGQKFCLKNKCFVYLSDACGNFDWKM